MNTLVDILEDVPYEQILVTPRRRILLTMGWVETGEHDGRTVDSSELQAYLP
jgi:hypothetical protein